MSVLLCAVFASRCVIVVTLPATEFENAFLKIFGIGQPQFCVFLFQNFHQADQFCSHLFIQGIQEVRHRFLTVSARVKLISNSMQLLASVVLYEIYLNFTT